MITLLFSISGFCLALLAPKMIELQLFAMNISLLAAPSAPALLYARKISKDACFYSLPVPLIALGPVYLCAPDLSFVVSIALSVGTLLPYDKIKPRMRPAGAP